MRIACWLTHPDIDCWNLRERHRRALEAGLPGAEVVRCTSEDAFLRELPAAEGALVWRFRPEWSGRAPRLAWVATPAAGREWVRVAPGAGLDVIHGSFHGRILGETVLACLLDACRGLSRAQRLVAGEPWPRAELASTLRTLRGSALTVLGFGSIGRWVARLARPFGPRTTGIRRHPAPDPEAVGPGGRVVGPERIDEVLPETDLLVLCLPGDAGTDGILDARRLARLPPHAALVNVGRGNAVDEDALARALERGQLAGAWLDVFREEPLPEDSPLRRAPNAVLLPHASAIAPDYLDLFVEELIARLGPGEEGARP